MTELQQSGSQNENGLARPALVLSVIALAFTGLMILCFVVSKFAAALGFLVYLTLMIPVVSMPVAVAAVAVGAAALARSKRHGSRAAALHAVVYGIVALLFPVVGLAMGAAAGS